MGAGARLSASQAPSSSADADAGAQWRCRLPTDIARAKGMTQVAREAGLGRESLYKALSPAGNPEFATILKVVAALGLQLHAAPAGAKSAV